MPDRPMRLSKRDAGKYSVLNSFDGRCGLSAQDNGPSITVRVRILRGAHFAGVARVKCRFSPGKSFIRNRLASVGSPRSELVQALMDSDAC